MESSNNRSITVGTDPVVIGEAKFNNSSERTVFYAVNTSTLSQVISISIGDVAVANQGIVLDVGGFYQESKGDQFKCTQERIWAIASAAGATLAIHERVEMR